MWKGFLNLCDRGKIKERKKESKKIYIYHFFGCIKYKNIKQIKFGFAQGSCISEWKREYYTLHTERRFTSYIRRCWIDWTRFFFIYIVYSLCIVVFIPWVFFDTHISDICSEYSLLKHFSQIYVWNNFVCRVVVRALLVVLVILTFYTCVSKYT